MKQKIYYGDILELKDFETKETIFEKVTSIINPDSKDKSFQIKTENLQYDFTNFYEIVRVIRNEQYTWSERAKCYDAKITDQETILYYKCLITGNKKELKCSKDIALSSYLGMVGALVCVD